MDTVNTELIRGHVDTIILNALLERDRYGYEILDMISSLSEGRYEIKQPTLYSCLKRLEKQGFITSYFGDESQGGRRRYYKLTDKGRETLEQDQREWEFSRTIINRLLSDKEIDLRTVEAPFNPSELRPLTRRIKVYDVEDVEDVEPATETETSVAPITPPIAQPDVAENVERVETSVADTAVANASDMLTENEVEKPNNNVEIMRIREQQSQASRLLGIGEFASRRMLIDDSGAEGEAVINADPRRTPPVFTDASYGYAGQASAADIDLSACAEENNDERLNYRDALSAIYAPKRDNNHAEGKAEQNYTNIDERDMGHGKARYFGDLKQSLYEEGFSLKPYTRANSANYYYMKFIYSNRIMRDAAILTYLVLAIEVLIMTLALDAFAIKPELCIIIAAIGLIIPIVPIVMWALNPTKRVKAKFNFGSSITYAVVAFVLISGISLIIALVIPSQNVDFAKGGVYIPVMLSALIPISIAIYGLLYRSGNYHLKK